MHCADGERHPGLPASPVERGARIYSVASSGVVDSEEVLPFLYARPRGAASGGFVPRRAFVDAGDAVPPLSSAKSAPR